VTVMVVQAGAAEQLVEEDPEVARRALQTIRSTGASALAEMRRVVEVLREDEAGMLAPQPGVAALPTLVEEARATGLQATLEVHGTPRDLAPGLDLTAYRIVQEGLTNARRHARASGARVVLRYGDSDVGVEVHDDGVGLSEDTNGHRRHGGHGGHGLAGMRERVSLYGGELVTESPPGGGFCLRAQLPVEPS
jgi:signal transduction histidine kinase